MSDVLGLRDKPTLVVGGGSGIGRATAGLLAAAGARVAVADLDGDRAREVAEEVGGHALVGDVTDEAAATAIVDEAHATLGGLAGVANIVGVAVWGDLLGMSVADWDRNFRENLVHHLFVGRAAARHMIGAGGGAMAFVTSVSGIYGAPMHAGYGAAKAGAESLARSMAAEWGRHGVRVNSVAPDSIATPRVVAQRGDTLDDTAKSDGVPLGRFGTPTEIAGPLVYLLSDLSSFLTGQCLIIDGGMRARFPHGGLDQLTSGDSKTI